MNLTFLGGTGTVTGSKYLLEVGATRVLIDCGLYQGYKWLRERNWQPLPLDVPSLDAVILTHAHLDHSGYIPALYKQGFRGKVYCHHATKALCEILLEDCGHIQEEDAKFTAVINSVSTNIHKRYMIAIRQLRVVNYCKALHSMNPLTLKISIFIYNRLGTFWVQAVLF